MMIDQRDAAFTGGGDATMFAWNGQVGEVVV